MSQCINDAKKNDSNRIYFKEQLKLHNIDCDSDKHIEFCNFITDPANGRHFQTFLLLCSGYFKRKVIDNKLREILADFNFHLNNGYIYSQVFDKDEDWYSFFKENAYPCGRPRNNEQRRGVSRKYVDEIMQIHDKLHISIERSIRLWGSLKHKKFCIDNIINPYYATRHT